MKKIILAFLTIIIISCESYVRKPKDLIGKKDMISLLADIYIYRSSTLILTQPIDFNTINSQILIKHNVTKEQFVASNNYYVLNTDQYKNMLDKVKKEILKR